jgi:hypothetical protein
MNANTMLFFRRKRPCGTHARVPVALDFVSEAIAFRFVSWLIKFALFTRRHLHHSFYGNLYTRYKNFLMSCTYVAVCALY